ncbi:MAG: hypothetical protein KW804_00175 [Candidatus Doudnabacteria bacterium]|nr:hypothetical protein [Candidatus Doudnabacteria bacterium]
MTWFKSKNDKDLIALLKNSGSDFDFDPNKVKYRLLNSIRSTDQKAVHFRFSHALQYSIAFACLVVMISTTFAFASSAKPGDKLFALNKFGEQIVLKLPLSIEQKAKVQEYIVTNRLDAMDVVEEAQKLQTVKESDESLSTAVNAITENKKKLENSGKKEQAERLEQVLDKLQSKAVQQEAKLQELEDRTEDENTRTEIRNYRKKIEDTRKKAQSNIRRFKNNDSDNKGRND